MDIKEIAEQVSKRIYVEDGLLLSKFISEKFAEALIESYKAELLKEVGEPVAWLYESKQGHRLVSEQRRTVHAYDSETPLFTSDQLAAALLKATKPLEDRLAAAQEEIERLDVLHQVEVTAWEEADEKLAKAEQLWQVAQGRCDGLEEKLAKAEQRVSEACAAYVLDDLDGFEDGDCIAEAIRAGEWRKFVKEV